MTAEEKANEYVDRELPIADSDEAQITSLTVLRQTAKIDYLAGYKEAKKWNKIEDGLPEKGVKCIVKMENGDHHISERVDLWSGQKHPVPQGVKQKQYWLGMFHMEDEIKYWREI